MFGSITKTFKKILGSKADRDIKEVMPLVEKIKAIYPSLEQISNDELREKTAEFKNKIEAHIAEEQDKVAKLKSEVEQEKDVERKEAIYKEIDEVEACTDDKLEEVLAVLE